MVANAAVLMFGGIETTEGVIANAVLHLLAPLVNSPSCVPIQTWSTRRSRNRSAWNPPRRSWTATQQPTR
ncbi:hypothetical protein [Streptomyces sp. NPDC001816]|uniref:hypothetical protein n=1 Tax=unclassified Streptomyces TaxID=2593676 RepID=UPI00368E2357